MGLLSYKRDHFGSLFKGFELGGIDIMFGNDFKSTH